MRKPSRLTSVFPRPTRFTAGLLVVGLLAVGAAWFVNRAGHSSLDAAKAEQITAQRRLADQQTTLRAYETGDVLSGPALAAEVGAVETLLPSKDSSPVASFAAIEASARQFGLQPSGLTAAPDYSSPPEAERASYPALYQATGSLRVTGPVEAIQAWLTSLESFPQMLTYTTSGISNADGIPSLDTQLRLWATDQPEWQAGRPAQ